MPTEFLPESLPSLVWVNKSRERTMCTVKKLSDGIKRDVGKKLRTSS